MPTPRASEIGINTLNTVPSGTKLMIFDRNWNLEAIYFTMF
jgi:hypothetical protein